MLKGDVSYFCDFANVTLVAGSTIRITHGPPTRGSYYIYYLANTGSPRRTDTDEVVRTTNAFVRQWLLPVFPDLASQAIRAHDIFFMEALYLPDHPFVTISTFDHPMILEFTNNEAFNISLDFTLWILETPEKVYKENILPYFKGMFNFYHAFGDPAVASGMAEFFKLWAREDVRKAWLKRLGL